MTNKKSPTRLVYEGDKNSLRERLDVPCENELKRQLKKKNVRIDTADLQYKHLTCRFGAVFM